ncbi:MAG: MFS transporter [Actinomycetales bacterium]|nr:MFS transporter [Candidatus Phosphoribacter baldrii]
MTFPTRWGPLRHTNFRWFFFGETINTAGSSMSGLALAFAVLHIDNSPTALGVVVAAWTVPMVGFMLIGGALADRLPRALVLRGCNLIEGVTQLISAALILTGTAQIWHLVVLQFIGGTAVAVSYPAFHGMVPILLPEADRKAAYLMLGQAQSALQGPRSDRGRDHRCGEQPGLGAARRRRHLLRRRHLPHPAAPAGQRSA